MIRKLTEQERQVCVVLPAVLVALTYLIFFVRPQMRTKHALQVELCSQASVEVRQTRLVVARAEMERLGAAIAVEHERAVALKNAPGGPLPPLASRRAETLASVSRRCEACGITVIAALPEKGGANGLAPALDAVGWSGSERWRLDLRGSYIGMVRLLEGLAAENLPLLQTSLEMAPASGEATPINWILIVRM